MNSWEDIRIYKVLKEKVSDHFKKMGINRKANSVLYVKALLYILLSVSAYTALVLFGEKSLFIAFLFYLLLFICLGLLVVTIAHDASHQALSANKTVNHILSFSWNIIGISKYLWEIKHHHSHHIYTNIPHKDVDIAESLLLRFSPAYTYRPIYKYQHLYAPFLYLLFGIYIVFVKDFIMLFTIKFKSHKRDKLPKYFLFQLIFTKLLFLTVSFIIPLITLPFPWWQTLIIYLASMAISGSLLLLVLVVPHINEEAALYENDYHIKTQDDWALLQIQTTIDSSVNSNLLNWLSGGLNTHLAHHLFPNICHVHYIRLTRIIKQVLSECGLKHKEVTFSSSIINHFKYLKMMGVKPAELHNTSLPLVIH